ncbi:DUF2853 family protein [Sphingobium sp. BYY-5]|uniref:DUF2853 family protein n=1 Tax=Sphingobium sp. BYY-5 TaxID=2926400 RepID=UPI001FA6FE90|nr:DUF2853 family protein [Sphingobium sp. BYY-5]MCI4591423.1 DUF2853 family protein [Sphingobium sp. BYY-5]
MAEDWSLDVKKYVPAADPAIITGIIRYCGIALQSRDASLVSFSDKTETGRVRENFLKKKLALTASDEELDSAIAAVGERMKGDRTKNRVTVYYLLAEHFGKLGLFDKSSSSSSAIPPVTKGPAVDEPTAPKTSDISDIAAAAKSGVADVTALGAAGVAAGAAGLAAGASAIKGTFSGSPSAAGIASGGGAQAFAGRVLDDVPVAKSGWGRWLPWLLLAAALLLLLWYLGLFRWGAGTHESAPSTTTPVAGSSVTPGNETAVAPATVTPTAPTEGAVAPATAAAAIPTGAGVTSEVRDGKPAVNVYFATGKTDVAPAFTPAAASLKSYLDKNAGSKLTVSGFNDKTGNAALNAELSKNRAKAVEAALVASGIPAGAIELVKPSDATDVSTSNAGARRVEVVVK